MTPILHRSLKSPYSQKVMTMMGYLDQTYLSFIAPKGLPRPIEDLLVGPYARRLPILQVGADMYCDSELINRYLAESIGNHALFDYPDSKKANDWIARIEIDGADALFGAFGIWELIRGYFRNMPARDAWKFITDRAKLASRLEAPDKGMTKDQKQQRALDWLASLDFQLADKSFLLTETTPTSIDFTAFTMIWYHYSINGLRLIDGMEKLQLWFDRMQGFGIGEMTEISGAQALKIALNAMPAQIPDKMLKSDRIGQIISHVNGGFQAAMNDPVQGILVGENETSLILRRNHPDLGTLHLHFPKLWY